MADVSRIAGGMDSMRLSVEEQATLEWRRKRGVARGLIAAELVEEAGGLERVEADRDLAESVAAEFAELCDVLGLEPPPGRPA